MALSVICLGGSAYDHVFRLPFRPTEPVKVIASGHEGRAGGMAATAAVAVAALGANGIFWGRIGSDREGEAVEEQFKKAGVDTTDLVRVEGASTAVSAILIDDEGERAIAAFGGVGLGGDPLWLPLEKVRNADAVLCDLRWPEGALVLLAEARKCGVPSVLDADVAPSEQLKMLLRAADHVLFSEPALTSFTGLAEVGAALGAVAQETPAQIGVTLGARGCCLWVNGDVLVIPGYKVAIRDTSGAGDIFHGAYALAVAEGRAVPEAARFANAAAALKCALGNGWQGMPTRQAVENLTRG